MRITTKSQIMHSFSPRLLFIGLCVLSFDLAMLAPSIGLCRTTYTIMPKLVGSQPRWYDLLSAGPTLVAMTWKNCGLLVWHAQFKRICTCILVHPNIASSIEAHADSFSLGHINLSSNMTKPQKEWRASVDAQMTINGSIHTSCTWLCFLQQQHMFYHSTRNMVQTQRDSTRASMPAKQSLGGQSETKPTSESERLACTRRFFVYEHERNGK